MAFIQTVQYLFMGADYVGDESSLLILFLKSVDVAARSNSCHVERLSVRYSRSYFLPHI